MLADHLDGAKVKEATGYLDAANRQLGNPVPGVTALVYKFIFQNLVVEYNEFCAREVLPEGSRLPIP